MADIVMKDPDARPTQSKVSNHSDHPVTRPWPSLQGTGVSTGAVSTNNVARFSYSNINTDRRSVNITGDQVHHSRSAAKQASKSVEQLPFKVAKSGVSKSTTPSKRSKALKRVSWAADLVSGDDLRARELISIDDTSSDTEDIEEDNNAIFSYSAIDIEDDSDIMITRTISSNSSEPARTFKKLVNGRNINYTPGKCVELMDGNFLKISKIVESVEGDIFLSGPLLMRHNEITGHKFPKRHNEVVQIIKVKNGQVRSEIKRPLVQALRNRHLITTNKPFQILSARTYKDSFPNIQKDIESGPLFCRWKEIHILGNDGKIVEESIERFSFDEVDTLMGVGDSIVRLEWRKTVIAGGSHTSIQQTVDEGQNSYKKVQQYTVGDTFCGAGGASCGAEQAGCYVSFGVDINERAIQTYSMNFEHKGTECRHQDIHDHIRTCHPRQYIVDILHVSPPCQPFSPAHTVPNEERDDANQAAIFSVGELVKLHRPRIVTLEETFGLYNRHKQWFDALIRMFIDLDYSVRWKIAKMAEYGLAQTRRRLLIIAAGPGETLPPFPKTTHSDTNPALKPLATIQDVLTIVNVNKGDATHHNVAGATYSPGQEKKPYSPYTQAKTITTSGGIGNYHPSGKRMFTIRELATLQKFPLSYQFPDVRVTDLRKQIGNAVPPYIFKMIYREIIKSLRKTDGLE